MSLIRSPQSRLWDGDIQGFSSDHHRGKGKKQKWQGEQFNGDVVSMQGVLELEWPFRDVWNRDKKTRPLFSLFLSPSCPGRASGRVMGPLVVVRVVVGGLCLERGSSPQCSSLWSEAEWTFVAEPLETPPASVWFLISYTSTLPIHENVPFHLCSSLAQRSKILWAPKCTQFHVDWST